MNIKHFINIWSPISVLYLVSHQLCFGLLVREMSCYHLMNYLGTPSQRDWRDYVLVGCRLVELFRCLLPFKQLITDKGAIRSAKTLSWETLNCSLEQRGFIILWVDTTQVYNYRIYACIVVWNDWTKTSYHYFFGHVCYFVCLDSGWFIEDTLSLPTPANQRIGGLFSVPRVSGAERQIYATSSKSQMFVIPYHSSSMKICPGN